MRTTSSADSSYDVVIAGGGMVGASLAIALAGLDLTVALVEAVPLKDSAQPSFDDRTIALSRGSQRILNTLGVWPDLVDKAWPIKQIHVSEQGRFGTAVVDGAEQGIGDLGHLVPARVLGEVLWSRIDRLSGIDIFCPGRLSLLSTAPDAISATLAAGDVVHSVSARLLAVADGARSGLRDELGVPARIKAYDQTAIVGNIAIDSQYAGHVAFERFTPDGPLALLPGPDDSYTFVLTRRKDAAAAVVALDDEAFIELLQQAFGFRLGRFRRVSERHAYPLHLVTADQVITERAAIIGNAAHGLHPVAGQGFNLGLRDAATLAEVLADDMRLHQTDPGAAAVLQRYRDWRQRDQRNVVAFTDGLIRLFDVPSVTASVARGIGLFTFDLLPGAKKGLAHHTMGLSGKLTRLGRGLPL